MHYGYSACTHEKALTAFWKVYRYYLFNIPKTLLRRALLFSHDKANKCVCSQTPFLCRLTSSVPSLFSKEQGFFSCWKRDEVNLNNECVCMRELFSSVKS